MISQYKKLICSMLIVAFMVIPAAVVKPNKAEALKPADIIGGIVNILDYAYDRATGAATILTGTATDSLWFKEYVLDFLVAQLKQRLLQEITASTVNWINGGFNGSPAYKSNFEGFLKGVTDRTISSFIQGTDLALLCSPFQTDVQFGVDYSVREFGSDLGCSLTDITSNVSNLSNNWNWDVWQSVTSRENNNAYGAYGKATFKLQGEIGQRQEVESAKVAWGSGFLSWEECTRDWSTLSTDERNDYANDETIYASDCKNKRILTPGSVINEQLNNTLPSGLRNLELADELNEIVNAVLTRFITDTFSSGNRGLAGLSASSGGNASLTNTAANADTRNDSIVTRVLNAIDKSLDLENRYSNAKNASLTAVSTTISRLDQLYSCLNGKISDFNTMYNTFSALPPNTIVERLYGTDIAGDTVIVEITAAEKTAAIVAARTKVENVFGEVDPINTSVRALETKLTGDLTNTQSNIDTLNEIRAIIADPNTSTDLFNSTVDRYQALVEAPGALTTEADVIDAERERDGQPGDPQYSALGVVKDMQNTRDDIINPRLGTCSVTNASDDVGYEILLIPVDGYSYTRTILSPPY